MEHPMVLNKIYIDGKIKQIEPIEKLHIIMISQNYMPKDISLCS